MKTEKELRRSAIARLNQIAKHSESIMLMQNILRDEGQHGPTIRELRIQAEKLLQCVHEYNSYYNCYMTGDA